MREFKLLRDILIVLACAFLISHIWLAHTKPSGTDNGKLIEDLYNRIQP